MFHVPGEAILFSLTSGHTVLVDTGINAEIADKLATIFPFWLRDVDVLVLTHADQDHIGGALAIMEHYNVRSILVPGSAEESLLFREIQATANKSAIPIIYADSSSDLRAGAAVFDVVFPQLSLLGKMESQRNATSLIIRYTGNEGSVLLTGDAEAKSEQQLLATPARLVSDVLKSPHHGSKTSSSAALLRAVRPKVALISAHKDNPFGHPHDIIRERYHENQISLFNTGEIGDIRMRDIFPFSSPPTP